jgi:hypothetical protein
MSKYWLGIILAIALFFTFFFWSTTSRAEEEKLVVPSPDTIRDYRPQPNRLMVITYANERVFIYRVLQIKPKPDCNQIKMDDQRRILITTQAVSQAYEYLLEPDPIMVSEWIRYED